MKGFIPTVVRLDDKLPHLEVLGFAQSVEEARQSLLEWYEERFRPTLEGTDPMAAERLASDWNSFALYKDALIHLAAETNLIAEEGCNWFMIIKEVE